MSEMADTAYFYTRPRQNAPSMFSERSYKA